MAYEAIITSYVGPSDSRGAKIRAKWGSDSITIDYPHHLSGIDVHQEAAEALRRKVARKSGQPKEIVFTAPLEGGFVSGTGKYIFVVNPAAMHLARVLVSRCEKGQSGNPYGIKAISDALAHFSPSGDKYSDAYKDFTGYARDVDGSSIVPRD